MQTIDLKKAKSGVLERISVLGHEQVVFCHDEETGLKAIIAIHNTNLGPALGGTRMWKYNNEEDALQDVLRLSRGMTFKAAISGLELTISVIPSPRTQRFHSECSCWSFHVFLFL